MPDSRAAVTWLVGDIGATNARFGLMSPERALLHSQSYAIDDYPAIEDALAAYLGPRGALAKPLQAAIAIASPIAGDEVVMTNHPWHFSISALAARFAFARLEVVNDFTALARALPYLGPGDRLVVGGGAPVEGAPIAVIGPGSGLGVSGLLRCPTGWLALTGEGGHATLAPASDRESAVIDHMRRHFDHVSAERALSGPGLVNLYNTLASLDAVPSLGYTAAQITDHAIHGSDRLSADTVRMFCAMLGTTAGNLALTLGAHGGVYIGGGIVPRLGAFFAESPFRERFEAKGRFKDYLSAIPTYVVTHPLPAFIGCAAILGEAPREAPAVDA